MNLQTLYGLLVRGLPFSLGVSLFWVLWRVSVLGVGLAFLCAGEYVALKRKEKQTKRQNRRQSVVASREQLYCVVQSRSPNHCTAVKDIDIDIADILSPKYRYCIDIGRGDINPSLICGIVSWC